MLCVIKFGFLPCHHNYSIGNYVLFYATNRKCTNAIKIGLNCCYFFNNEIQYWYLNGHMQNNFPPLLNEIKTKLLYLIFESDCNLKIIVS